MSSGRQHTADTNIKDVVKKNSKQLKKILELRYGLLDQLVSQGACDLDDVKVIENTESSSFHRKKIVKILVDKLTSSIAERKQILELLKMNNQRHVAEFIEQEGRKCCSVIPTYVMLVVRSGILLSYGLQSWFKVSEFVTINSVWFCSENCGTSAFFDKNSFKSVELRQQTSYTHNVLQAGSFVTKRRG